VAKDYEHLKIAFEKAITQMQNDLQYLADHTNVSKRFINKQNTILKTLIDYYNGVELYCNHLERDIVQFRLERSKAIAKLQDRIICFEAICLLFGINDFPMWLSFGKTILIFRVEQQNKFDSFLIPSRFLEQLKTLPKDEVKQIFSILQREEKIKLDKHIREQERQLLTKLSASK